MSVTAEIQEGVAWITLDRPPANSYDPAFLEELDEAIGRVAAAGMPLGGPVDGRLLLTGIAVQLLVATTLALGLAWAGRVAEVAGRALRRRRRVRPDPRPARLRPTGWVRPAILLAAGLGERAPPPVWAR